MSDQKNPFADEFNPYASPATDASTNAPMSDAEAMRNKYLKHEASVKSIGSLYFVGAVFAILGGVGVMFLVLSGMPQAVESAGFFAVLGLFYLMIGSLQMATAIGLRKLQPWARIVATVFSIIGLIGFPIGTLISAYFLYLLLSEKGNVVFSERYRQVILATPHIKYKTSLLLIVLLIVLIFVVISVIAIAMSGG